MRVNGVVVLHPAIDQGEGGSSIGDRVHPDVIALEGLHERLGHAIALGAFDRGEAGHQIERQGDLDRPMSGKDRSVVGEPLHGLRRAHRAKALLDAVDHHVADHLTGDAGRRGDPTNDLAVVTIKGEGEAHDLAVPAGELQAIRAPADIRAQRSDLAVVIAGTAASGMPGQQQCVSLHQSVDALGVDRGQTVGSPLALEERGDPPVPIGWPRVDKATDLTGELNIARSLLRPATSSGALAPFDHIRARHAQRRTDPLHWVSPGCGECYSKIGFFARASSRASLRISTSMLLRPNSRSRSRTRSSSRRSSVTGTTSSSARTASRPPSLISRLQRNTRLGDSPWRRATQLIDMPGCIVSAITASFRSVVKRRRLATPVITSTFENVSDIGVCPGLCLGPPAKAGVRLKTGCSSARDAKILETIVTSDAIVRLVISDVSPNDLQKPSATQNFYG